MANKIPALVPRVAVSCGPGPTDFTLYQRPKGTVKAVMLFVDFPDAPSGKANAAKVADHLLGAGRAQRLYNEQSYGKLALDVAVRSDLGWRRMPKDATSFSFDSWQRHRDYVAEAAARFPDVKFNDFHFTLVVAPEGAPFPASPALTIRAGDAAQTPTGKIRLGVTFGQDSYKNTFVNLVHEVGHLFGLPDLYPVGGGSGAHDSRMGCWSLMSDIFHSVSFMGWDRHKSGWLDAARARYFPKSASARLTLTPLSASSGTSMAVFPVDDPKRPSKVMVVELAQAVVGTSGTTAGEGVLLYTVDASVETGKTPLRLVPRKEGSTDGFGHLFEAPYRPGDSAEHRDGGAALRLRVLGKNGATYDVQVDYTRS